MGSLEKAIHELSKQAPGRCTTCLHCLSFDMPDQPRHWCRGFATELTEDVRLGVRDCPRWRAYSPPTPRKRDLSGMDPEIRSMVEREDRLFWRAKKIALRNGLCLKTIVSIAHPGASAASGDLDWIDELDERYEDFDVPAIEDMSKELRDSGYAALAGLLEFTVRSNQYNRIPVSEAV